MIGVNMATLAAQQKSVEDEKMAEEKKDASAPAPTANRWAALRGFISSTMEQNPAFAEKQ